MIRTILVPLDGSELAEQGLHAACSLARRPGTTLVLVRAVPFYALTPENEVEEVAALQEAKQYLQHVQQRLITEGFAVRANLLPSDPVGAILFAIHEHGADLVCMSTHGTSGVRHSLLGSVAEAILRRSQKPILIVRANQPHQQRTGPFQKILVPLDGTPLAEDALSFLAREQVGRTADVILLRVVQPILVTVPRMLSGGALVERAAAAEREANHQSNEAAAYLTSAGQAHLKDVSWRTQVTIGNPADTILEVARAEQADLIVMATHGRHGVDRLLHGSVASSILHHAEAPVLLLQHTQTDDRQG